MAVKQKTYAALRAEFNDLVSQLQAPDCDVDQAAQLFEQAIKAADVLDKHLQAAENRITKLAADKLPATDGEV